jgi:hypothetical protein
LIQYVGLNSSTIYQNLNAWAGKSFISCSV